MELVAFDALPAKSDDVSALQGRPHGYTTALSHFVCLSVIASVAGPALPIIGFGKTVRRSRQPPVEKLPRKAYRRLVTIARMKTVPSDEGRHLRTGRSPRRSNYGQGDRHE